MRKVVLLAVFSILFSNISSTNAIALEKCLANFADSEWANGTPSGVRSLLGFDLVETIKRPQSPQAIHRFYLYGEHTVETVYTYKGKNCLSREITVSNLISAQTINYEFATFDEYFTSLKSPNFLWTQNTIDFYSNLKEYFSKKKFVVNGKQLLSGNDGHPKAIQELLRNKADLYSSQMFVPAGAFIYFPTRCAHWINTNGEKLYAVSAGHAYAEYDSKIIFESNGECIGELKLSGFTDGLLPSGVKEKISDIKYVVTSTSPTTTITCKKGKTSKKVKGVNPKCPTGYKKV
jgi:hypothetical protein